jgi:hypothetical protein
VQEVAPGIFHWSAEHPNTGSQAHSYLLAEARTVLDPMVDDDVLAWLRERPPERVVLTNRHHWRQADRLVEAFDCPVLCPRPGLHEFEGTDREVEPYDDGQELASGLVAHEVDAISPDDFAVHYTAGAGALAFADGLIRRASGLDFVSDGLIGDDPPAVKRGLVEAFDRLAELVFDALLFAHGEPLPAGGSDALREFVRERRT